MSVAVKNNNPGCIRSGKGFAKYATLEEGYIALNSLLYRRYDRMTLKEMFQIYAPSGDGNNPSKYAKDVLNYLRSKGYKMDFSTRLDFSDPDFRAAMTMAISEEESGKVLGGEALALQAAKSYNPQTDSGKRYSATESRRKKYSSVQMIRSGSSASSTSDKADKTPGLIQSIQSASQGSYRSLSDLLKTAGTSIAQEEEAFLSRGRGRV